MKVSEFLKMMIGEVVPLGIMITILSSFIMFVIMKTWRIFCDVIKS
jgi:hypothetical protein